MAWKWNGEGQRNKMRAAITAGTLRAVWTCKGCGRGQVGGKTHMETFTVRRCRYCRHETITGQLPESGG